MKEKSSWKLVYDEFVPEKEGLREALCTLGNGYYGVRGAAPEAVASDIHYPGTYIASLYNRLATNIAGRKIINEDFVNCPNWIFLTFRIGIDDEWFCPSASKILFFRQELDMQKGILIRRVRFENHRGQITFVETKRIVHLVDPHCGALTYSITPENYSDWITVGTMLDGAVLNTGVPRYRQLNHKHWKPGDMGSFARNGIYLSMVTSQSKVTVTEASKLRIFIDGNDGKEIKPPLKILTKGKEVIGQEFRIFMHKKQTCLLEKNVSIYTSKDRGVKDSQAEAIKAVKKSQRFAELFKTHQQAWVSLWKKFDIEVEGDSFSQKVLRLHTFHLLQTASVHNIEIDWGFPARGLHGEAYRGHIFWDEIFALPFYTFRSPEVARAMLLYRFRRLPRAREYARKEKYKGAMFPWQSGSSGREETQVVHLNPLSGKWGEDYSHLQRHVSLAIAYNVWHYWEVTRDLEFMAKYGAEILVSIAQFFASITKYSSKDKRYHIEGVMGPDEFHEYFPGTHKGGLRDNAYTNVMVVWLLLKAMASMDIIPEGEKKRLLKKLKLRDEEIRRWKDITRKMKVIINNKGIIAQFDGYFKLKELNWNKYREEYGNIQRMDRILKAEGKSPDDYKISKQADVLMIFYLLPLPEAEEIFERLGYRVNKTMVRNNYEYYLKRTSHGSTLSKIVHCLVAHQLGKLKISWWWFMEALESDIYDTQGGTTPEGIHGGVMGGTIDIVIRGFAGIDIFDDRIRIDPHIPHQWKSIKFKFCYNKKWIRLTITQKQLMLVFEGPGRYLPLPVEIRGRLYCPRLKKPLRVSLKKHY